MPRPTSPRGGSAGHAPIHGTWQVVQAWLRAFGPAAEPLVAAAAWSPVFSGQSFESTPERGRAEVEDLWTTGGDVSWLGGPAVGPWPHDADGAPLAHVATLSLADVTGASQQADKAGWPDAREGLPRDGVVEIFHDLRTYGWEAADGDRRGWLVRWLPEPDRSRVVDPPSGTSEPHPICQAGVFLPGFSVPSSLDIAHLGDAVFEVAEEVTAQLQLAWLEQQTGSTDGHPVPVTHVYGHSQNGRREVADVLDAVLPCADGDEHRLVLDVESWTHLAGWFGDAEPLEVWMRRSDLEARRFDAAWCLIRSD